MRKATALLHMRTTSEISIMWAWSDSHSILYRAVTFHRSIQSNKDARESGTGADALVKLQQ